MKLDSHPKPRQQIVYAAVLVGLLAISAYYFSYCSRQNGTASPTSSSVTVSRATPVPVASGQFGYVSSEFGFTFNYPSTWYLSDSAPKQLVLEEPNGAVWEPKAYVNYYPTVAEADSQLLQGSTSSGIDDFMTRYTFASAGSSDGADIQKTTLAGSPARSATLEGTISQMPPEYDIVCYHGGHVYILSFADAKTYGDLSSEEKTVISSFRF